MVEVAENGGDRVGEWGETPECWYFCGSPTVVLRGACVLFPVLCPLLQPQEMYPHHDQASTPAKTPLG